MEHLELKYPHIQPNLAPMAYNFSSSGQISKNLTVQKSSCHCLLNKLFSCTAATSTEQAFAVNGRSVFKPPQSNTRRIKEKEKGIGCALFI
eukprot:2579006-Ditylum_brightwellii.AAC.1